MTYEVLKTWGLREFIRANPDIYTPEGSRPFVVSNGFLGGQVMFDPKTKKVYGLCMKELEPSDEFIEMCEGMMNKKKVHDKISYADAKAWLAAQSKEAI